MDIKRFYDESLAQASYVVYSDNEIALIDPARNPEPYYEFAEKRQAKIVAVVETHLHADFVSSHLEIHRSTGATIFVSKHAGAEYPHETFDEGKEIKIGGAALKSLNTPGHSPDSISVLVIDEEGIEQAVLTGDTLFIGEVGRPDLRQDAGNFQENRNKLARQLYRSVQQVLRPLEEDVLVYPAHGAGSLCGKNISNEPFSTIGKERQENYALQPMDEDEFVGKITEKQPHIPAYFAYDVELNRKGADDFKSSIEAVPKRTDSEQDIAAGQELIIDTRDEKLFKKGHYSGAINIMDGPKFETWLGTLVKPDQKFYLIAENESRLFQLLEKAAKIGYEKLIKKAIVTPAVAEEQSPLLQLDQFKKEPEAYEILDLRTDAELENGKVFETAVHIPLQEIQERLDEINTSKPVVVHCAAGYRSAIGASLLSRILDDTPVYDLSDSIKEFH